MTKKSKFLNISILFVLLPLLLFSFFFSIPKIEKSRLNVSAADNTFDVFSFIGSELDLPCDFVQLPSTFNRHAFAKLKFTFGVNDFGRVYGTLYSGYIASGDTTLNATYNGGLATTSLNINLHDGFNPSLVSSSIFITPVPLASNASYGVNLLFYKSSENITKNINRVRVFSDYYDIGSGYFMYRHNVQYLDVLGNYVMFSSVTKQTSINDLNFSGAFALEDRTYFINLGVNTDNSYYQAGFTDGYNDGLNVGTEDGYRDGYDTGLIDGYANGYNAGIEEGGSNNFTGLMSAVLDVPLRTFTSLLNFEILGVNILGFITALLTLAIIIFIVKLCIGGK